MDITHRSAAWALLAVGLALLLGGCSTGAPAAPAGTTGTTPASSAPVAASAAVSPATSPVATFAPSASATSSASLPPSPSPSPSPAFAVLGWSTSSDSIDAQDPSSAPSKLVKAGGKIKVCGKDRLVFWVSRTGYPLGTPAYLSLKKPSGEVVDIKPKTYDTPDGVIDLWWGYTDGPLDSRDSGTYEATVAIGDEQAVVAKAKVIAVC